MIKVLVLTVLVTTLLASNSAIADTKQRDDADEPAVVAEKKKKPELAKPAVKCEYRKITGSNRRERICRTVSQMKSDEEQARVEMRELRRVLQAPRPD